ncbi:MAG TPA: hypothetical protein VFA07_18930 [Chthonomonadaceae bacterium]|nr:hypothetical protein [Chthonomonadaceae bacterium]
MVHPDSYLFVTLDSCRYDTFEAADAPNLKAIGTLWKAEAPAHFTFASHMAMFVGFTPGVASECLPYVNPKFGKIFKLRVEWKPKGRHHVLLEGRNIIHGFRKRGYLPLGTGGVSWFNPRTEAAQPLIRDFEKFYFPGDYFFLRQQVAWMQSQLDRARRPVFAFMNIGETHVPYYYEGAPWSKEDNPCVPFGANNRADECRMRQRKCLEFVDEKIGPLLEQFENVVLCGDHGDCWGEDGLWEHGINHAKVKEVPLLMRLQPREGDISMEIRRSRREALRAAGSHFVQLFMNASRRPVSP